MKDHIYETYIDLGVLGEQKVEVFYDWCNCIVGGEFDAPQPDGAIVTSVIAWLDGKEVNVFDYLNSDLIEDLAYECTESYRG